MKSPNRRRPGAATAGLTDALTASWKKAFDGRIRAAALKRPSPRAMPIALPAHQRPDTPPRT